MTEPGVARAPRRGLHLGPVPITPLLVISAALLAGSVGLGLWAIVQIRDERQVTFLVIASVGAAIAFVLVALACLRGMWRAAAQARSGRALALAIVGGLAAIGAIGSLTVTLILTLLWGG